MINIRIGIDKNPTIPITQKIAASLYCFAVFPCSLRFVILFFILFVLYEPRGAGLVNQDPPRGIFDLRTCEKSRETKMDAFA